MLLRTSGSGNGSATAGRLGFWGIFFAQGGGGDSGEEVLGGGGAIAVDAHLAFGVQHTDVHPSGVQIDPTVVSVLRSVESHPVSSLPRRGGVVWPQSPYPDAWQGGAWMRITVLQPTGVAV